MRYSALVTIHFVSLSALLLRSADAFCPEGKYIQTYDEAGGMCLSVGTDGSGGILGDSNYGVLYSTDTAQDRCQTAGASWEVYTCEHAQFHYALRGDELCPIIGEGACWDEIIASWTPKCCKDTPPKIQGCLSGLSIKFKGDCTYEAIVQAAALHGNCTEDLLGFYVEAVNRTVAAETINNLCTEAEARARLNFVPFEKVVDLGYQHYREFLNGGSPWNEDPGADLSKLINVAGTVSSVKGITWPSQFSNFDSEKCQSNAAMCCWVSDSDAADGEPLDNTDVCYVDMEHSKLASHVQEGIALYPGDSEGPVNCRGFTWGSGYMDPMNKYKGNVLFDVAMRYGLLDNKYNKNVPGAPMCACYDQMPVVSRADCTDLTVEEEWEFHYDDNAHQLVVSHTTSDISYGDCGGASDLETHYSAYHGTELSAHVPTGDCAQTESVNGYAPLKVKWMQVAGKGLLEMEREDYTKEEFNALWKLSPNQILFRHCTDCISTHRFVYYKRHDINGTLPDIDLLHIVKDHWYEMDGHMWKEDFDLYSSREEALKGVNPWLACNFGDRNVGFPRNCGPVGWANEWNTFTPPITNTNSYGRNNIGFYVEVPVGTAATK